MFRFSLVGNRQNKRARTHVPAWAPGPLGLWAIWPEVEVTPGGETRLEGCEGADCRLKALRGVSPAC